MTTTMTRTVSREVEESLSPALVQTLWDLASTREDVPHAFLLTRQMSRNTVVQVVRHIAGRVYAGAHRVGGSPAVNASILITPRDGGLHMELAGPLETLGGAVHAA